MMYFNVTLGPLRAFDLVLAVVRLKITRWKEDVLQFLNAHVYIYIYTYTYTMHLKMYTYFVI